MSRHEFLHRVRVTYVKMMWEMAKAKCRERHLDIGRNHDFRFDKLKACTPATPWFSASPCLLMKPRVARHLLANETVVFTRIWPCSDQWTRACTHNPRVSVCLSLYGRYAGYRLEVRGASGFTVPWVIYAVVMRVLGEKEVNFTSH